MKILILSIMYPNSKIYLSGVFVHKQAIALQKLGIDITVIAPIPWSPFFISKLKEKWEKLAKVPMQEKIDGILVYHPRYIALPKGWLKHLWSYLLFFTTKRLLKKMNKLNSFNLIHVQGSLPEDYTAFLLANHLNIPFVLTIHGASVYFIIKNKKHFKKSKIAIENANAVIAVSSKVAERIKKYTNKKKNIFTIYNGFDLKNILVKNIRTELEKDEIIILFGATIVERKGLRILLKSFSELVSKFSNIKLWIAGGGELLNEMQDLAKSLGIYSKTKFFGAVTHKKMLLLMNNSNLFVLPSWDEAFGVVYLEAMSFKKPIVGTIDEGISDVITNGINGVLVKRKDSDDLTEKLPKLIIDENYRNKIGKNGFETVTEYTWQNNAKKNIEVYKNVLELNTNAS